MIFLAHLYILSWRLQELARGNQGVLMAHTKIYENLMLAVSVSCIHYIFPHSSHNLVNYSYCQYAKHTRGNVIEYLATFPQSVYS